MTPSGPEVSVIIPVHNGGSTLEGCLRALFRSEKVDMEVIVVDDASSDCSEELASSFPVRLISLPRRVGAAAARNVGAERARAPVFVFVDADVQVVPDTLARFLDAISERPHLAAIFGSYSTRCPHPDFFSQYKNLHHHFVHQTSRKDASTFWTACGAIRRESFRAAGGFSLQGRPGPDLADIELGYRLKESGCRIELMPEIQVLHDKRYDFLSLLRSDFLLRAIPWTRIMWKHRVLRYDLNTRVSHIWSVVLLYCAIVCTLLPLPVILRVLGLLAGLLAVSTLNGRWFQFCCRERGGGFASRAMAMEWLYFLYSGLGAVLGTLSYLLGTSDSPDSADPDWEHHAQAQSRGYFLPPPLARHKGEVTLRLIRSSWGERGAARRVLKTDLYEEAFGDDHLLFRRSEPWWSPRGVGIDVSMQVLRRARERAKETALPWLGPVRADVRRLPFRAGVFDLILSTSTLDHFLCEGDLVDPCAELARVTDFHGALFLTMDNPRNPWIFLRNLPLLERALRGCGVLSVPLGRTLSWERMHGILAAHGWRCSSPSFLLHYPRALLIPVSRHWRNATGPIHKFIVALDRLGKTSCARYTGLYYTLWCRKGSHASEPKSILELRAPFSIRKIGVYPAGRRFEETTDALRRWGRLRVMRDFPLRGFPLPTHVQVQTQSRCNGRCVHCPYPILPREHGTMSWDLFREIVEEVTSWPHPEIRTLHLMLQNEPLLDPRLPEAVGLIKRRRSPPRVCVVTNGTLLTPDLLRELQSAGLDQLVISLDAATEPTYAKVHPGLRFARVFEALDVLLHAGSGCLRWSLSFLKYRETLGDLEGFLTFCRQHAIPHRVFPPVNRAGCLETFSDLSLPRTRTMAGQWKSARRRLLWGICPLPMNTCCILYTGDVILCCHDWRPRLILGNVRRKSLQEIWQGEAFARIRSQLASGRVPRKGPCLACSMVTASGERLSAEPDPSDDRPSPLERLR